MPVSPKHATSAALPPKLFLDAAKNGKLLIRQVKTFAAEDAGSFVEVDISKLGAFAT